MLGVQVSRVDVVERFLLREALFLLREAEGGARELHEVFGVALVHDREVRGESGGGAELAEQAVAGGVERAAVHARGWRIPPAARRGRAFPARRGA